MQLWEHQIADVIDEVYREGSKLFGDILWQIVIGVKFNACSLFVRELKSNIESVRARTLDLDHDAELHCHLIFLLCAVPDRTPSASSNVSVAPMGEVVFAGGPH
jgi:hypothetical protein